MVDVDPCEIVKQNTPEAFDVFWGSVYARTHYMTPNRLRHARHIASLVPAGASVLDTGCGDGTLLGIIGRGVGVDYSFVSAIRTNGPSAVGDATRLPVHDNCFGCVTCIEVLEHVYNPGLIAAEMGTSVDFPSQTLSLYFQISRCTGNIHFATISSSRSKSKPDSKRPRT